MHALHRWNHPDLREARYVVGVQMLGMLYAPAMVAGAGGGVGTLENVEGLTVTTVVDGMDVVTAIEGVPTDGRDKPIDAVRVESITIAE